MALEKISSRAAGSEDGVVILMSKLADLHLMLIVVVLHI